MLLLTLLAGCLSLCSAQTTYFPFDGKETAHAPPIVESIKPTPTLPATPSADTTIIAVLRVALRSTLDLNEMTVAQTLNKIQGIIQELHPGLDLKLKKITQV